MIKVLQICNKVPYPPKDGGSIAMNNITEGLINAGITVTVLAINTPKHYTNIEQLPVDYRHKTNIEAVYIDTNLKPINAFLNLFTSESYNIARFYSKAFEKKLVQILSTSPFDIIQLESVYITPYLETIKKFTKAKIVLRSHNIEFKIWEGLGETTNNPLKKKYIKLLASRLKKHEVSMLNLYDGIAAITTEDLITLKNLGCVIPIKHIPFGINVDDYSVNSDYEETPTLFHIGAMDWMPNIEGLKWFLDNVWKNINTNPIKLHLAGRRMPLALRLKNDKNIIVEGEVKDSHKFMHSKSIMIVPLLSGGGMRVKIIEGMAMGKAIISTSIGAEGINYENGKNIIIADDAHAFASAISDCIKNPQLRKELGENARALVEREYNNKLICEQLTDFYSKV